MKIGSVSLNNNVFLAPMAGVTDMAFRLVCKEMGTGLVYSEMVSIKGLYYEDKNTEELMLISDKERPAALQVFGSDPNIFKEVIQRKLNENETFDIIDINMGCPTPKIVKNGDGSALMKDPKLIGEIVREAVKASSKPVTVKIRKGWDEKSINAVEIAKIVEAEGASAIAVHGRTREQFYTGKADWNIIKAVKAAVSIPVIGNGDVFEPEDGIRMLRETESDGIMIGRGARGNPWLFKRIVSLLQNGIELLPPTGEERIKTAIDHLRRLTDLKGEKVAVREMRKHIAWYIKGMRNSAELRNRINTITSKDELEEQLFKYLDNLASQA